MFCHIKYNYRKRDKNLPNAVVFQFNSIRSFTWKFFFIVRSKTKEKENC